MILTVWINDGKNFVSSSDTTVVLTFLFGGSIFEFFQNEFSKFVEFCENNFLCKKYYSNLQPLVLETDMIPHSQQRGYLN